MCTKFLHFETGTWKLRHNLTYLGLMYHRHILTRNDNKTIKTNYAKQRDDHIKGDWFQLLAKDFQFIEEDMSEKEIGEMSKASYKKKKSKI